MLQEFNKEDGVKEILETVKGLLECVEDYTT